MPNLSVRKLDAQVYEQLRLRAAKHGVSITIAEITYVLNAMPNGKRRHALQTAFDKTILTAFQHGILPIV